MGAWLNLVGAGVRVLSAIDTATGMPIVPASSKYAVLMTGQSMCALAQPFIMFVTTKFANSWFADDQRALARLERREPGKWAEPGQKARRLEQAEQEQDPDRQMDEDRVEAA